MEEEIERLTELVKQLQQEKENAEKELERSSQKWEDRLKRLEQSIGGTGSDPNIPPMETREVTIPIGPNREAQEAMNVQVEHIVRGIMGSHSIIVYDHSLEVHQRIMRSLLMNGFSKQS